MYACVYHVVCMCTCVKYVVCASVATILAIYIVYRNISTDDTIH